MAFGLREIVRVQSCSYHAVFKPNELHQQLLIVDMEVFALLRETLQTFFKNDIFENKELTRVLVVVIVEVRLSL